MRRSGPHQKRKENEQRCEAVGGNPIGPPLAGLLPVKAEGRQPARVVVKGTNSVCAVKVCVLGTQRRSQVTSQELD